MQSPISKPQPLIGKQYAKRLRTAIDAAERSVFVIMFDWRWYELDPGCEVQLVNQALVRAARRGLNVMALTSSPTIVKTLIDQKIVAKKLNRRGLLHSKLWIIDETVVFIGSHNLTQSAMQSNVESSLALADEATAKHFAAFFHRLWLS